MKSSEFVDILLNHHFNFITGVPDSLFKVAIEEINSNRNFQHIISNNEGEACAIAAGYHLATNQIATVYMQNSGLGNSINPLTSLLDKYIYGIPVLLLITWRGQPGIADEPQHKRMGEVLLELLKALSIPYEIASADTEHTTKSFGKAKKYLSENQSPFAIIFPNGIIESEKFAKPVMGDNSKSLPSREEILECIVGNLDKNAITITTTGKTSRELFEIRKRFSQPHSQDFLTVGSMGCASAIAFGFAMGQPQRKIVLIDGDGACLMRMETLALIGHYQPRNLIHILIDNNAYESTGSQKTLSDTVNFAEVARACHYPKAFLLDQIADLPAILKHDSKALQLLVIRANCYSRTNLGRPTSSPEENKRQFMNFVSANNEIEETV